MVTFSEVVGMEELNNFKPIKVKNCKVSMHSTSHVHGCNVVFVARQDL